VIDQRETAKEKRKEGESHEECQAIFHIKHVHTILIHRTCVIFDEVLCKISSNETD